VGIEVPDFPDPGLGPGELTAQTHTVLQALRELGDDVDRAVMAFHLDDFSTAAIAEALGLTPQRVRDIKKKVRAALKTRLSGHISWEGGSHDEPGQEQ
jgi:DNA-directed RNA polymerase specialized sigma24 family protein